MPPLISVIFLVVAIIALVVAVTCYCRLLSSSYIFKTIIQFQERAEEPDITRPECIGLLQDINDFYDVQFTKEDFDNHHAVALRQVRDYVYQRMATLPFYD
jgi:hypothetical protein